MKFVLFLLMFASLAIVFGCQKNASTTTSAPKTEMYVGSDGANRITLAAAKKDFDSGNAVFVDTRGDVTYNQEHVKGALNIPAEAMATRYTEIPTDKKIIAYCS